MEANKRFRESHKNFVQSHSIDEKRFAGSGPLHYWTLPLYCIIGKDETNSLNFSRISDACGPGEWLIIIYEWGKLLFRKLLGPPPASIAVSPLGKSRFVTWLTATLLRDSRSSIRPPNTSSHGQRRLFRWKSKLWENWEFLWNVAETISSNYMLASHSCRKNTCYIIQYCLKLKLQFLMKGRV